MNKFYVTKEIAEKMRAKGYNVEELHYENSSLSIDEVYQTDNLRIYKFPRIDEVLAWLREEKKRFVVIHPEGHDVHYYYTVHNLARSFDVFEYTQSFATYEEAALEGIEYVIDNLI